MCRNSMASTQLSPVQIKIGLASKGTLDAVFAFANHLHHQKLALRFVQGVGRPFNARRRIVAPVGSGGHEICFKMFGEIAESIFP